MLGWIGQKEVETPYIEIGQLATLIYFSWFLLFIPIYHTLEDILDWPIITFSTAIGPERKRTVFENLVLLCLVINILLHG